MYYGTIKKTDIADGPGVRVSLFVSGCTHRCKGCFQPETWDFSYGSEFTEKTEHELIDALRPSYIRGLTILGGEPFEPENQKAILPFLEKVKAQLPEKDIWFYTGYLFEELSGQAGTSDSVRCEATDGILKLTDVLVDGEFEQEHKDISLRFRGSGNQRIINVPESLRLGRIIWWNE